MCGGGRRAWGAWMRGCAGCVGACVGGWGGAGRWWRWLQQERSRRDFPGSPACDATNHWPVTWEIDRSPEDTWKYETTLCPKRDLSEALRTRTRKTPFRERRETQDRTRPRRRHLTWGGGMPSTSGPNPALGRSLDRQ